MDNAQEAADDGDQNMRDALNNIFADAAGRSADAAGRSLIYPVHDFHNAAEMKVEMTSMIAKRDELNESINRLKRKLEQAEQVWWNGIDQFAATISRNQEALVMQGQQQAKRQRAERWNVLDKYAATISRNQEALVMQGRQEMRQKAEEYQKQAAAIIRRLNECK